MGFKYYKYEGFKYLERNRFSFGFHFFGCIHKNMNLYKNPRSNDYT